jgi:Zinc-finger of C2H2 type/Zinc finger, C2H2 type
MLKLFQNTYKQEQVNNNNNKPQWNTNQVSQKKASILMLQRNKKSFAEDEMWVEKAIDIGTGTSQADTSPKTRSSINKNSAAYKANCLTPRSCPVCARVYSNVSNLRQHMRLIHNPTAVVCPICQKHFNSDLYLKRHYASIHSINTSGSETEGGEKSQPGTNASGNNSGTWSYQSNDGTIQALQQ